MSAGMNVPSELHTELSKYASLLRTIRTKSTLDLVPQLTSEVTWTGAQYDDESESESDVEDQLLLDKSEEETQPGPSVKGKEKEVEAPRLRKKQKKNHDDLWTRWPLLPEDCPEPEWTWDEEIAAIAERCIHLQNVSSTPPQPSNEAGPSRASSMNSDSVEEESIEEVNLSPAFLSGLSLDAVSKLTSLLSLLAAHRLNATWSKHNRVAPMNWRDILEIAGVSRLFDVSIVADVQGRLEATFGTSDTQVVHRMGILDESDRKLAAAITIVDDDLFDIKPLKNHYAKSSKRKRMHDDEGAEKNDSGDGEEDDNYSEPESEDDENESTNQLDDDLNEDISRQLNESSDVGAVE